VLDQRIDSQYFSVCVWIDVSDVGFYFIIVSASFATGKCRLSVEFFSATYCYFDSKSFSGGRAAFRNIHRRCTRRLWSVGIRHYRWSGSNGVDWGMWMIFTSLFQVTVVPYLRVGFPGEVSISNGGEIIRGCWKTQGSRGFCVFCLWRDLYSRMKTTEHGRRVNYGSCAKSVMRTWSLIW
jgi:hypothetical protein